MNDDTSRSTMDILGDDAADADEKIFTELAMPADHQIIWIGLAAAAILLFGSAIWGALFGA